MKLSAASPWIVALAAMALAGGAQAAQPRAKKQCLGGMVPVLRAGGFSRSLDCDANRLKIWRKGVIRVSGRRYDIYEYTYVTPREHGGTAIVILRDGAYLGLYNSVSGDLSVEGDSIVITPHKGSYYKIREYIKFNKYGPPKEAYYEGNINTLYK